MATDEEYMDFLNKANEDPNPPAAEESSDIGAKIALKNVDGEVPVALRSVVEGGKEEVWYESDADEVFVGVSLAWEGGKLPDEDAFAKLVHHPSTDEADISILDVQKWDPRGHYSQLVDKVREAVQGSDVRVYRVELGGTRVEYWVVGVIDKRMVGAKALAIES